MTSIDHYKWLWQKTYDSYQREKIIDTAIENADLEALKWFWQQTYDSYQKEKIFKAMLIKGQNRQLQDEEHSPVTPRESTLSSSFEHDLFICHASEDKEPFVKELAEILISKGLNVWYDDFTLSLGDSLRRSIDKGIAKSHYGVVVLSENFFGKEWPQKELDGLVARENGQDTVILPIWYGVTKEQVQSYSPILAGRVAASTSKGIDYVVDKILKFVKRS